MGATNDSLSKESTISENISKSKENIVKPEKKTSSKNNKNANIGIFTPIVKIAKNIFGEKEIKKTRNDFISFHSNVITSFVKTSESKFGKMVLASLFDIADENDDGVLDRDELKKGLKYFRFSMDRIETSRRNTEPFRYQ